MSNAYRNVKLGGGGKISRFLGLLALAAFLAMLPITASAQTGIWLDGTQVHEPYYHYGNANIVDVWSGLLNNYLNGSIKTANVFDNGRVDNSGNATITTANVNGGLVLNFDNATIGNLTQSGGFVYNGSRIDEMTYRGGSYVGNYFGQTGTIGTLNVEGKLTGNDWGTVQNLNLRAAAGIIDTVSVGEARISTTVDTVTFNGLNRVNNYGTVGTANVNGGYVYNSDNATIGTANVHDGYVGNRGNALIETANVFDGGEVNNYRIATITTANVFNGGLVYNYDNATITTANVHDGYAFNYDYATITTANVNGGSVYNGDNATIGTMFLNGGFVSNRGMINEMTYTAGAYTGQGAGWTGTIGTLNVEGKLTGNGWGTVQNLNLRAAAGIVDTVSVGVSSTTVDTVTFNGLNRVNNYGTITTANVDFGFVGNYNNATITTANVNGGWVYNYHTATIETANVNGGAVNNYSCATIENANVSGGEVNNYHDATIGTANVNGGWVYNSDNATIGTANVSGGEVNNYFYATIENANVSGGEVNNYHIATIATANVHDGYVGNRGNARIGTANVFDNGRVDNSGNATITTANVHDGYVGNRGNARIGTANVFSGMVGNCDYAIIGEANVDGGWVYNDHIATIETANVNGGAVYNHDYVAIGTANVNGGFVGNYDNVTIGTANVNGGLVNNYFCATIENANVSGGEVNNYHTATIGTANVNGGLVYNYDTAIIGTANVNGGEVYNRDTATIGNLTQSGGSVYNGSRIDAMTYIDGNYAGQTGTIGLLTIAGELYAGDNWGTVGNILFSENGLGALVFTGFADGTFSSIDAQSVDFSFGNIFLDLSRVGIFDGDWTSFLAGVFGDTIFFESFFGETEIAEPGQLASFQVGWENQTYYVYNDGVFADGWGWNYSASGTETGFVYSSGDNPPSSTPEPATLLILGLGAVGAGFAARRRK